MYSSLKFRKHPGGIYSWLKWVKVWVSYSFYASLILVPFSIFLQFDGQPVANVVKLDTKSLVSENRAYTIIDTSKEILEIKNATWFDKFVFGVVEDQFLSFFNLIFYSLTLLQLFLIFKKLELSKPFHLDIAKRLNYIGFILIGFTAVVLLRVWYMDEVIKNLTLNHYRLDYQFYFAKINEFKLGILILIIAAVYKNGCILQNEQDLTI
jgi:hypothetical protein